MSVLAKLMGIIEYEGRAEGYLQNSDSAGPLISEDKFYKGRIVAVRRSDHDHTEAVVDPTEYRSVLVEIDSEKFGDLKHYDAEFLVCPDKWDDKLIGRRVFVTPGFLVDKENSWARYADEIEIYDLDDSRREWKSDEYDFYQAKDIDETIADSPNGTVFDGKIVHAYDTDYQGVMHREIVVAVTENTVYYIHVPMALWNDDLHYNRVRVTVGDQLYSDTDERFATAIQAVIP